MTDPTALIAARRATAEQIKERTLKALAAMIRRREPITFTAVAIQAGVSREYLYRTPDLATKIKSSRGRPYPQATPDTDETNRPIVTVLREHIRRIEATHAESLRGLREENKDLRRQLESALGSIVSAGSPPTSQEP